jgi:hypothetical protein
MLSTADRVVNGDAGSWCGEWIATGERVATIAEESAKSGHEVSARAGYLRAATYYAMALSSVDGTKDPAALLRSTFAEHRRCFDAYTELLDPPAERVEIPYEGTTMPGYLFRPASSDTPRRTLIMNNGSDGPVTSIWPPLSAGGVARGYNVLIFDGPGQQSMLFERGVPFRHDWEHVITPVLDFLLARADVDPARIVPEGEQFWPGQSQQLFEKLQGTKQLVAFTADEGADRHCEPLARSLLEQRMFDWLDETLPR